MTKKGLDRMESKTVCTAKRRNGTQCLNYAIRGTNVCRMHGGAAPQVRAAAQVRILMASDLAAKKLVDLMQSEKVDDRVKLAAAKDLLDRANLAGKQSIEVGVVQPKSFEDWIGDAIVDTEEDDDTPLALPPVREDIVDADVVEDEPPLMNRHDRAAFMDVEREKRRAPVGLKRNTGAQAAHDAALAEQETAALSQADAFEKERRYREAYARLMGRGVPREVAEVEAQRYADAPPEPEPTRRRRTRSSEARYSR